MHESPAYLRNAFFFVLRKGFASHGPPPPPFRSPSFSAVFPRAVATKTIRLVDGVGDAAKYDTSGVHVLHLVRDPRAVTRSQLLMRGFKGFESVLPNAHELEGIGDWKKRQRETRRAVGRL